MQAARMPDGKPLARIVQLPHAAPYGPEPAPRTPAEA